MANILIYGDSNTHGTKPLIKLGQFDRYPRGQRWPDVMAEALGPNHHVIAEGLPGRTTVHDDLVEGGGRNGIAVLPAVLNSHVPLNLVVILLGTNDLKHRFSVTAFEIARSVERVVAETRSVVPTAQVMVISPAPVRELGCLAPVFAGAEARQEGLEEHMEDMARRAGVAHLRAGEHVTVSDVDGVHWEAEDHARFGRVVADAVSERLAASRA